MIYKNLNCVVMLREEFIIENGYHDSNVILIPLEGSFTIKNEKKDCIVSKREAFFFRKEIPFCRKANSKLKLLYISFDDTDNPYIPEGNEKLQCENRHRMEENICLIENEPKMLCHGVNDIFYYNSRYKTTAQKSVTDEIILFLKQNYRESISMNETAKKFGLSPANMIFLIKKATGKTPVQILTQYRIENAEYMLLNTDQPINNIAIHCGFQNEYYFSTVFKKHNGIAPYFYRKKYML